MPDDQTQTDTERNLTRLLERHRGDAMSLAAQLLSENAGLREDRRTLTAERDAARALAPAEGAVVLTGDDARLYTELTTTTPLKEVGPRLKAAEAAVGELGTLKRQATIRTVADLTGRRANVLERLADGLEFEVGAEVERDGRKTRPVSVKDRDGKLVPYEQYEADHWTDFLPALTAQGGGQQGAGIGQGGARPPTGPGARDGQPAAKTAAEIAAEKRASADYQL